MMDAFLLGEREPLPAKHKSTKIQPNSRSGFSAFNFGPRFHLRLRFLMLLSKLDFANLAHHKKFGEKVLGLELRLKSAVTTV